MPEEMTECMRMRALVATDMLQDECQSREEELVEEQQMVWRWRLGGRSWCPRTAEALSACRQP